MVIKYDFVLWISIISSGYVSLCFKTLSFLSPEVKFFTYSHRGMYCQDSFWYCSEGDIMFCWVPWRLAVSQEHSTDQIIPGSALISHLNKTEL